MDTKQRWVRPQGVALPSLILVTLVLLTLASTLLTSSTTSLRLATYELQSDQAYFAAEAGLVHALDRYSSDGALEGPLKGELGKTGSKYSVDVYENRTDEPITVVGGVSIPPDFSYLISEGTTKNGAVRRMGALVRHGDIVFKAGVLAERIEADGAVFSAYDSRNSLDPAGSLATGQGVLTSSGNPLDEQFRLIDSTIDGNLFVAAGTPGDPNSVVDIDGLSTINGTISRLAEAIEIDDIQVPQVDHGQGDSDDPDDEKPPVGQAYKLNGPSSGLTVTWTGEQWRFSHASYNDVLIGPSGGQGYFGGVKNNQRVTMHADGTVEFLHGDTYIDSVPGAEAPSTENPPELKSGAYNNVRINSEFESGLQEGGVFVVSNLEIVDGGQLKLDYDSPVSIYVTDRLVVEGENAILNTTQRPPNLKIYYTGTADVNLSGGAQSYFTLIAPNANVNLTGPTPPPEELPPEGGDPAAGEGEDGEDGGPAAGDPLDPEDAGEGTGEGSEPDLGPERLRTVFYGALVGRRVRVSNAEFFFDIATEGVGVGRDSSPFQVLHRHRL